MITTVYTQNAVYSSDKDDSDIKSSDKILILNCAFKQSSYGSITITRPTYNGIIEVYPNQITHIIHSKN